MRPASSWASADDWAALFASFVIMINGLAMLWPSVHNLMDRAASADVVGQIRAAALSLPSVLGVEKLRVRTSGINYLVEIHVEAPADLSLRDSHVLAGRVKSAIRTALPRVSEVVVHMEPYESAG
jgi:divalent metal cation (Fe/Co/Zn/Cd) transporter